MARVAQKSRQAASLSMKDLPHLEEYVRMSGAELDIAAVTTEASAETGSTSLPAGPREVTKWMLVKSLWKGRGTVVFNSERSEDPR